MADLGAMPDGGVYHENIVLNDITLWSGGPQDADKTDAWKSLPAIRRLIFEGRNADAQKLIHGDTTLQIKNANTAIIYISAGTDFRHSPYRKKTLSLLKMAMTIPFHEELAGHVSEYQKLFKRATLTLDNKDLRQASLPTDERLEAFAKDPSDNGLPVLYF